MTESRSLAPRRPAAPHLVAMMDFWPPSVLRLHSLLTASQPAELPEPISHEDRHWISTRLTSLREDLDSPESRLRKMSSLTRMFFAYPAYLSEDAARAKLNVYADVLADVDASAVSMAVDQWIRGAVPDKEAAKNVPSAPRLRALALTQPSSVRDEIAQLQRLRDARVVPRVPRDPATLAERRAYAEKMQRIFRGEEEMPRPSRKAVDL